VIWGCAKGSQIKQVASQQRKRNHPLEILLLINVIAALFMWTAQSWIPVVEAVRSMGMAVFIPLKPALEGKIRVEDGGQACA
jgi:hypothetical protein